MPLKQGERGPTCLSEALACDVSTLVGCADGMKDFQRRVHAALARRVQKRGQELGHTRQHRHQQTQTQTHTDKVTGEWSNAPGK